jgi:hypothetical protein
MIQENFTGKGDVQHRLKGWKPLIQKSKDRRNLQGNHHLQLQRKINLNVDLPIINLQDARRPFKIKRRMEKMEIEKEAQHLKVAKARSTCEDCEEHDHVQDQQGRRH